MPDLAHDPVVILAARGAFALLFASAAWHKLRDRTAFASVLAAYRVLPASVVPAASVAVVGVELGTAAAWLVPGAVGIAARATIVLLAAYAAAIGVNLARGRRAIDCGCGVGGAAQPIGEWLLVRNALLAVVAWSMAADGAAMVAPAGTAAVTSGTATVSPVDSTSAVVGARPGAPSGPTSAASGPADASPAGASLEAAVGSRAFEVPSMTPLPAGGRPSAGRVARSLVWIDGLSLAGVVAVLAAVWTAAHGLAAAAARVRAVDARHAQHHGADA